MNQSNTFDRASGAWHDEVDTEATRLLESGEASNPHEANKKAVTNVQRRRQQAARGDTLAKVADAGGPLSTAAAQGGN